MIAPVVFLHHFRLIELLVHILVDTAERTLCEYAYQQSDDKEQHELQ